MREKNHSDQRVNGIQIDQLAVTVSTQILVLENIQWSIRQGDRPSSIFFLYGLDPLLVWLKKRLKGIPTYTMDMFNAPTTTKTFKVEAYVYDVKPTITSL